MSNNTPSTPETTAGGAFDPSYIPPKKPRTTKAKAPAKPKAAGPISKNSDDPMEKLMCITLHDSPEIPPGGQFVGVNDKQFRIRPGVKVVVPRYVVEVLDNAIQGVPDVNEKMQVVGTRAMPRLPYTVHHDWDGQVA